MQFRDPFKSSILGLNRYKDFINLCEFPAETQLKIVYRASRDGFSAEMFHLKCDQIAPTITILKSKQNGYIFGGFTEAFWSGNEVQKRDSNAFIFSLTNKENYPCKMNVAVEENAVFCSPFVGPSFGIGDIHIEDNANSYNEFNSFSDLGAAFHSKFVFDSNDAKCFLAGSYFFELEILVLKFFCCI